MAAVMCAAHGARVFILWPQTGQTHTFCERLFDKPVVTHVDQAVSKPWELRPCNNLQWVAANLYLL